MKILWVLGTKKLCAHRASRARRRKRRFSLLIFLMRIATEQSLVPHTPDAQRGGDTAYWTEHYRKLGSASGPDASEYVKDVAECLLARKEGVSSLVATLPVTDYYKFLLASAKKATRIEEDPPAPPSR